MRIATGQRTPRSADERATDRAIDEALSENCHAASTPRSADWQSAVSQVGNLPPTENIENSIANIDLDPTKDYE